MSSSVRTIQCHCGKKITMNDTINCIAHEPPECDYYLNVLENNRNPKYAEAVTDRSPATPKKTKEIGIMVRRISNSEILSTAEDFGF